MPFVKMHRSTQRQCCVQGNLQTSPALQLELDCADECICHTSTMPLRANCHPSNMTFYRADDIAGNCADRLIGRIDGNEDAHLRYPLAYAPSVRNCVPISIFCVVILIRLKSFLKASCDRRGVGHGRFSCSDLRSRFRHLAGPFPNGFAVQFTYVLQAHDRHGWAVEKSRGCAGFPSSY